MNKNQIVEKIRNGEIGIFPTDTAFGIGCRMDDENAVAKVFKIRNRPNEKALIVLVGSIEMAEKYLEKIDSDVKEKLINKYWPGGLTIILKCKKGKVPGIVRANGDTLAVRMPNHKDLLEIINKVGVPIVAPSANFSGEKTPFNFSDVSKKLIEMVDFILRGVCTMKGVSTIIDCSGKKWILIRQGVVNLDL